MQKPLAILLVSSMLAACGSTPPVADTALGSVIAQPPKASQVPVAAKSGPVEIGAAPSRPVERSVYFPYDKFTVDAKFEQMLNANAAYLTHSPASRVVLEGSADERGSREYNLALGQKRAEAVRKTLSLQGVSDKQMEAISYGKERPKAVCHDESCWQENRRTDIVYSASR